jgi:hypothetical protein
MLSTIASMPKFTIAPKKRPTDVQNAKAVARTRVSNCSGSHSEKRAKLPPKKNQHDEQRDERHEPVRQIERPAERARDRRGHADETHRERLSAADLFGHRRSARQPTIVPIESSPVAIDAMRGRASRGPTRREARDA